MISVVFATHNGADTLERMLRALGAVHRPEQGVEFIAINNASSDETATILSAAEEWLGLRVLEEPRRGKSYALNRGIEASKGDLVVFTDDDVIPEPDWLTGFAEAAMRHADVAVFAGQVRHEWEALPPRWLEELGELGFSYGGTPITWGERRIGYDQAKGANIMVRRSAINDLRFPVAPGVNFKGSSKSPGGEDTRFVRAVAGSGGEVLFVPNASLRHIVLRHEVGLLPVYRRYLRIGAAQVASGERRPRLYREAAGLMIDLIAGLVQFARGNVTQAGMRVVLVGMRVGRSRAMLRRKYSRGEWG